MKALLGAALASALGTDRAVLTRYDEICDALGGELTDAETDKLNDELGKLQDIIDPVPLILMADFGYDRYPGVCHIIPNAGVLIMAVLYGDGDLPRTAEIATNRQSNACASSRATDTETTFSLDAFYLMERGELLSSAAYMIASVVMSVAALVAAIHLVRTVG